MTVEPLSFAKRDSWKVVFIFSVIVEITRRHQLQIQMVLMKLLTCTYQAVNNELPQKLKEPHQFRNCVWDAGIFCWGTASNKKHRASSNLSLRMQFDGMLIAPIYVAQAAYCEMLLHLRLPGARVTQSVKPWASAPMAWVRTRLSARGFLDASL